MTISGCSAVAGQEMEVVMTLEKVFECKRKIKGLQSGPLGRLLEGFCQWLEVSGLSYWAIRHHAQNLAHFCDYLRGKSDAIRTHITRTDVDGFLKEYPSRCETRRKVGGHLRRVRSSVNRFTDYLCHSGLFEQEEQASAYQSLLDSYAEWLLKYQHAAPSTREIRLHSLGKFLAWFGPLSTEEGLSEIVRRHICAAKVEVPSNGAHAFRHCFASRMVQQGHSLKAIADVLGHRHLATTFIYTKIDFNALRQVALEWPQER
jgi:site-specific recombinase XerD